MKNLSLVAFACFIGASFAGTASEDAQCAKYQSDTHICRTRKNQCHKDVTCVQESRDGKDVWICPTSAEFVYEDDKTDCTDAPLDKPPADGDAKCGELTIKAYGGPGAIGICDGMGNCLPVRDYAREGVVCRRSSGTCDAPDTCDGMGKCVANFAPYETPCKAVVKDAKGVVIKNDASCDLPDICDGEGKCIDVKQNDGYECEFFGDSACYLSSKCANGKCIKNPKKSGAPCGTVPDLRKTPCDARDTCDGKGVCKDIIAPKGKVCRPARNECDVAEVCDGLTKSCGADKCVGNISAPDKKFCKLGARRLLDVIEESE